MKLTFISDTHSQHRQLELGSGDVLVHCGDFTAHGDLDDVAGFAEFIAEQDFAYRIVIAGNHDWCFEDQRRKKAERYLHDHGIIYLNDSGVEIEGIKFWGSPVQPEFCNWAFNRQRGEDILYHWEKIPANTDVLITHGPAKGMLDRCDNGYHAGCEDLLNTVRRIKPSIHASGHIHESYGIYDDGDTIFVNACNLDERYRMVNPPVVLELE